MPGIRRVTDEFPAQKASNAEKVSICCRHVNTYHNTPTCNLQHYAIISHYGDVIMDAIASQITSLTIVYSIVYLDADERKHQSSASLAFVRRIHRVPVNSPHKWPVTRKMFPFDDVIMFVYLHLLPPPKQFSSRSCGLISWQNRCWTSWCETFFRSNWSF